MFISWLSLTIVTKGTGVLSKKRLSSFRQAKGWLFFWNLVQCFTQQDALRYAGDQPLNSVW